VKSIVCILCTLYQTSTNAYSQTHVRRFVKTRRVAISAVVEWAMNGTRLTKVVVLQVIIVIVIVLLKCIKSLVVRCVSFSNRHL
jgi:hypothetical protein